MKIIACFDIFNEAQFIRESVEAVASWCDNVIIVDGALNGYPAQSPISNDGTLEIIAELMVKHPNITLKQIGHFAIGYEKIDAYLSLINEGDYILRLDGDEIAECPDPQKLRDYVDKAQLPLYTIPLYEPRKPSKYCCVGRLFRKTPNLKVTTTHLALTNKFDPPYTLAMKHGQVIPDNANLPTDLIKIKHLSALRNVAREKLDAEFEKYYQNHQVQDGII